MKTTGHNPRILIIPVLRLSIFTNTDGHMLFIKLKKKSRRHTKMGLCIHDQWKCHFVHLSAWILLEIDQDWRGSDIQSTSYLLVCRKLLIPNFSFQTHLPVLHGRKCRALIRYVHVAYECVFLAVLLAQCRHFPVQKFSRFRPAWILLLLFSFSPSFIFGNFLFHSQSSVQDLRRCLFSNKLTWLHAVFRYKHECEKHMHGRIPTFAYYVSLHECKSIGMDRPWVSDGKASIMLLQQFL